MILLRPRGPRRSWAALLGGRADPFFTSRPPFFTSASQWSHDQGGGGGKRFSASKQRPVGQSKTELVSENRV